MLSSNQKINKQIKAYNKIDQISIEEVDRLAHMPHTVVIR